MSTAYDLFIIGAGPGGYVAAIHAAKAGLTVAIAEKEDIGGTCLNRGCIPTKALLHAGEIYRQIKNSEGYGFHIDGLSYDINKIYEYKNNTALQLRTGVENLLKANGIAIHRGCAVVHPDKKICVTNDAKEEFWYESKNILIASGSHPSFPPIEGANLPNVITSDDLLAKPIQGSRLVIIGGGVIGVEFATVFSSLGWEVTIIETLPALLANMDKEISQNLKLILKKQGVTSYTSARVTKITNENELLCHFTQKENDISIAADTILMAVGRKADTESLFAKGITPKTDRGYLCVDEHFCTSLPGIYAVGDVIGKIQLAHAASAQGIAAVSHITNHVPSIQLEYTPSCVYSNPEIACVGLTVSQAKDRGIETITGKFIMSANGKSIIQQEERGFIKLVFEKNTKQLIGAQLMCARATDIIGQLSIAVANKLTQEQLTSVIAAHPTFYEAVNEAAEDIDGNAIHIMPKKGK